jgi:hypothetical protein
MQDRMLQKGQGTDLRDPGPRVAKEGRLQQSPLFVWPIKDPKNVNRRRKEAGFTDTVENYARRFGIEYKVMTLAEAKAIEKKYAPDKQ